MKYFIKTLTLLIIIAVGLFGYVAFYQYGCECGYKAGFADGMQWIPQSMIKADSLINNNKYHNYLLGFKYYKMLDNSGSERLK